MSKQIDLLNIKVEYSLSFPQPVADSIGTSPRAFDKESNKTDQKSYHLRVGLQEKVICVYARGRTFISHSGPRRALSSPGHHRIFAAIDGTSSKVWDAQPNTMHRGYILEKGHFTEATLQKIHEI